MSTTNLPAELWDAFIDLFKDDFLSLRTISLVCKAWSARTRIHLFAIVTLRASFCHDPTKTFFSLISSPQCTFTGVIKHIQLSGFDNLACGNRHPRRFLSKRITALSVLTNLEILDIYNLSWELPVDLAPILEACPQLKVLRLSNVLVHSRCRLVQTVSQLHQLEELDLYIQWFKEEDDTMVQDPSPLVEAPANLRRVVIRTRDDTVKQGYLLEWLTRSRLKNLQYVQAHPTKRDFGGLAALLTSVRRSLKEFHISPMIADSGEGGQGSGFYGGTLPPFEELEAYQRCKHYKLHYRKQNSR
jgi:hypothetical protein